MIYLGPNLPESGRHREICAEINRIKEVLRSLDPVSSPGSLLSHTALGVARRVPETEGGGSSTLQFRGEWTASPPDGPYKKGDLVIRGGNNKATGPMGPHPPGWNRADQYLGEGYQPGLYMALRDLPDGSPEPREPMSDTPETPGGLVPSACWETFARGSWHQLTVRDATNNARAIRLLSRGATGNVTVDLARCRGKNLELVEIGVCVNGVQKYMMVLGSAPYDTPASL